MHVRGEMTLQNRFEIFLRGPAAGGFAISKPDAEDYVRRLAFYGARDAPLTRLTPVPSLMNPFGIALFGSLMAVASWWRSRA